MTFIIAIQLNDSILVTADNKKVVLKETGEVQFDTSKSTKIHLWDQGIITGTGEIHVVTRSIEFFKKEADSLGRITDKRFTKIIAAMVKWYNESLPRISREFDSPWPHYKKQTPQV